MKTQSREVSKIFRSSSKALFAFALFPTLAIALSPLAITQQVAVQTQAGITIRGTVRDSAGNAVAGATVQLEQTGASDSTGPMSNIHARTDTQGSFAFAAIQAGNYTLTAEKSGLRSSPAVVAAKANDDARQIVLVLASTASPTPAMEFADSPNFTIAGVTDWTAVGGHGSDASLRTSESLAREAITLKSDASNNNASVPSQAGSADSHRQAGEQDEKNGNSLAAIHEFEQAVRLDPSEQNYFAWGSELLLHRAVWQAKEVFEKGATAWPKSARMLAALGTALFAGARYDQAAERLCAASDLDPADPEPYLFLGKVSIAAPEPLPCAEEKLARFASLQPGNSLANYFYAMAIWKQQQVSGDPQALQQVEAFLNKAVAIDAKCSDGYLQLGILKSTQRDYPQAIALYTRAIEANPQLGEAHYRLGVAYDRLGQSAKAKQEFQLHDEIEKQQAVAIDQQRREVKQFQVAPLGEPSGPPQH